MTVPRNQPVKIGPSILSADFLTYGDALSQVEQGAADYIHFDVMDGHFVPNISIGFPLLEATLRGTSLPIDVHLMIGNPDQWAPEFAAQGVAQVTFHVEATNHAHRVATSILKHGVSAGIAINPATPVAMLEDMLPFVSNVLVMTIDPGFGGQELIPAMVGKVMRVRELIDRINPECALQVDGGVSSDTIAALHRAGANSFVAGSAVFNDEADVATNIKTLHEAALCS